MIFQKNTKIFYREIRKQPIEVEKVPPLEEIETFWSKIWSEEESCNEVPFRLGMPKKQIKKWKNITSEESEEALRKP